MKKLIFLCSLVCLIIGCKNFVKVNRTVTKTITVPFNINTTSSLTQINSIITANQITNLFDPDIYNNSGSVLEKMDVNSFNVSGTVNEATTTATQVGVNAYISTGGATPLLSDTKLIRIGGNQLLQDAKDILNVTTGDIKKEISFKNALASINAEGVEKIRKIIAENLLGVSNNGLDILLTCAMAPGKRLSGQIVLTLNATLTYSRCEEWKTLPIMEASECRVK